MSISTHVLDTTLGRPGAGVPVVCEQRRDGAWREVGRGVTDDDGRIGDLLRDSPAGEYRLVFATGTWFAEQGRTAFWGDVVVAFHVTDGAAHHHVPLLLSPHGYTTYRGS